MTHWAELGLSQGLPLERGGARVHEAAGCQRFPTATQTVPSTPDQLPRINPQFVPNFVHNWVTAFTIYPIIPV